MLTFEYDKKDEFLMIHGDADGLQFLQTQIKSLLNSAEKGAINHLHLMSTEWGGSELTSQKQTNDENVEVLNHVKIFCW